MSNLVRARIDGQEVTVGAALAEINGWDVLDDDPRRPDGRIRPATRANGRPSKPQTTVADAAAKKAGQPTAADNSPSKE